MVLDLFRLDGKTALVTGASQGLGRGMALALAEAGADVALAARSREALQQVADEIAGRGRRALPIAIDLSAPSAPAQVLAATEGGLGPVDVLVTAAATQVRKPALDMTQEDWDRLVDLNLRSVYFLCQAVARTMVPRGGGKIINVASLTSVIGWPNVSIYGATKGGIVQMTKAMALEWAVHGIRVNAIGPGTFHTNLTDALYRDPQRAAEMKKRIPLGRPGVPEDLAGAVVYLASAASNYVTGQVLYVDGGWLAG